MNQPQNFLGQPSHFRTQQAVPVTPIQQTRSFPVYEAAKHVPPEPPMPTLTITPKGVLHLHASLRERLGLYDGQPLNLRPPEFESLFWHLDLRKHASRQVYWHGYKMRADGIRLPAGLVTANLILSLLPGEPDHKDYYPMLAVSTLNPST